VENTKRRIRKIGGLKLLKTKQFNLAPHWMNIYLNDTEEMLPEMWAAHLITSLSPIPLVSGSFSACGIRKPGKMAKS
jgi:hypothetical protein